MKKHLFLALFVILQFCVFVNAQQIQKVQVSKHDTSFILGNWDCLFLETGGVVYDPTCWQFYSNKVYRFPGESGKWELLDSGRILKLYNRSYTNPNNSNAATTLFNDVMQIHCDGNDKFSVLWATKDKGIRRTFMKDAPKKKEKSIQKTGSQKNRFSKS